ncbi:hypothetical protein [Cellulomonas terrae]|uniref:Uncharacterized protein n=1 Tax=Cellulomonas terrae TaxID=311234 RepID=A0A511JPC5_9CELL|nr:hypothetical protein [Cellulomonas terrae]GEL99880.1 hypothetical protein CTE05_34270 [Cellulomonas terrae]
MTPEQWWANLLQGSVAAVLSLVGLFAVFWLTLRVERNRDATRRADEAKQRREERVTISALTLIRHFANVPWSSTKTEAERWRETAVAELVAIEVLAAPDQPALSRWAGRAVMDLIEAGVQDEIVDDDTEPDGGLRAMDHTQEVASDVLRTLQKHVFVPNGHSESRSDQRER